jgi:3-hydroxybutyryl-CoA dehydrogenase
MKIGIIGAGTMGSGIAQAFAQNDGYSVKLCDIKAEWAENGKKKISRTLSRQVAKNKLTQAEADVILSRITTGTNEIVEDCDLVLEAALEKIELKKEIFESLQKICHQECIFATNTSSLSITEISAGLDKPVIGMHFFNPAPVMKLVEITAGLTTPSDIIDKVKQISTDIGKTPVIVNEAPGFVVNRILIPMINEAIFVLSEGIASADDIDTAMKLGANHPMGPLALADLVGNDIVLDIMEVLHKETGDDKYRPCPMLRKMVRAGKLGRKTGQGFFNYTK